VFHFPIKAPEGAITANQMGAMEQLKLWKMYQDHWTSHKVSMTCYYRDSEFLEVGNWIWNNFDSVAGISFLPYSEHTYRQAPYQPITEQQYAEWVERSPKNIDWTKLTQYEKSDNTVASQTFACTGNSCEL
jgi:ribonucleoside-diphosphate reductase alpha chain